jgi:hypothetical protein
VLVSSTPQIHINLVNVSYLRYILILSFYMSLGLPEWCIILSGFLPEILHAVPMRATWPAHTCLFHNIIPINSRWSAVYADFPTANFSILQTIPLMGVTLLSSGARSLTLHMAHVIPAN